VATRCWRGSVRFASEAAVSVYKGVLEEMGSGNEIPMGNGRWTTRVTYGGYGSAVTKEGKNRLGGWTRHGFIDVGGTRIPQALVSPMHENLLISAVGQEVEIGVSKSGKSHQVVAIRTPRDGVVKASRGLMLSGVISTLFKMVIALVVLALVGVLATAIVEAILGPLVGNRTAVLVACLIGVVALLAWIVWENVRGIARTWAAWAAV
jgi:hypothetical protein